MEELTKKLLQMKELTAEAGKTLENLSQPKVKPTQNSDAQKPETPAKPTTTPSKKDPKKMAEQLKNADAKKMAMDNIKSGANLLKFNDHGQWSLMKNIEENEEELEKSIKKKLAAAAVAGSALFGGGGEAKADVGHLKQYLHSIHGMEIGDHKVEVSHKDNTKEEFKGTAAGAGKFRIKVGDYHIDGSYSGVGSDHNKIKLTKPYHHELKHQPYEGKDQYQFLNETGTEEADTLHHFLSGGDNEVKGLHHYLMAERKPGDKRGLDISSFNLKKDEDLDKVFPVPLS
jgi:hypothetical protein